MAEKVYATEPKTLEELAKYGDHIVQYSPDYSLCAGCESCTIMCALEHDGYTGPNNGCIKINLGTRSMMHEVLACQQCNDHPCYDACPKKGEAMKIDENGIVYIVKDACIGCGLCAKKCKFYPSRITIHKNKDRKKWKAYKCDLCRDRPEGPACIQYCPVRCIGLASESVFVADNVRPTEKND